MSNSEIISINQKPKYYLKYLHCEKLKFKQVFVILSD